MDEIEDTLLDIIDRLEYLQEEDKAIESNYAEEEPYIQDYYDDEEDNDLGNVFSSQKILNINK